MKDEYHRPSRVSISLGEAAPRSAEVCEALCAADDKRALGYGILEVSVRLYCRHEIPYSRGSL